MSTSLVDAKTAGPYAGHTDEQLLLEYRRTGNRDLFAALVQRYERELFSYLRRYLNQAELAEDAFQATFLQVHLKRESFEAGRSFRPWLYTIATNQAIDAQRRNKRHRMASLDREGGKSADDEAGALVNLLESSEAAPTTQADEVERREWVRRAVDQLPEHLRSVLHLVFHQGMKYRDAAEVLHIPVGTIKSRMHSAVERLSDAWRKTHAEDGE